MNTFHRIGAALFVLLILAAHVSAGTLNEAVNGDFSGNRAAPTPFNVTVGSNDLFATTQGGDLDVVTVNVPAGAVLNQLFLRSFTQAGFDGTAFVGLQSGSTFTVDPNIAGASSLLGWAHFTSGNVNTNLLPTIASGFDAIGFTPPLSSGPYTLFFQQLGTPVTYQFDFVVAPVPEPATFAFALAGAGLAMCMVVLCNRRRRCLC
jgi:PEP-CTERM motif